MNRGSGGVRPGTGAGRQGLVTSGLCSHWQWLLGSAMGLCLLWAVFPRLQQSPIYPLEPLMVQT